MEAAAKAKQEERQEWLRERDQLLGQARPAVAFGGKPRRPDAL